MMTQPLPEEISVLTDINQRRKKFPDAPLKVRGRVFDDRVQLNDFMWENTEFENCDFVGCTMLRGTLGKVRFANCLFVANRWDGGEWNDVTFVSCAWRGRFNMGVGNGTNVLRFEGCEFSGATPEEIGYGGRAEQYGIIGGTNGDVIYEHCEFERMYINGGASLTLQQCTMRDVVIYAQDDARIFVENVVGRGLVNFGTGVGKFSSVSVKKSSFADSLVFESAKIGSALFEDVTANLDLDIVTAESVVLRRMIFASSTKPEPQFKYGLTSESAKIRSLRIEDCAFQGDGAALYLMGEKNRASASEQAEQSLKGIGNVFSTDIGSLLIRNTPIIGGRMEYMNVTTLALEDLKVRDADFSNGKYGKMLLRNVSMSGKVEFSGTTIIEKSLERVTDTSTGTAATILN